MEQKKIGRTICRLAVVSDDFSTYYIPGITMITDQQVSQIEAMGDEYHILDEAGELISTVSKSAPCVVDWTDVYEGPDLEFLNSDELVEQLVSFGNYLFEDYGVMATNTKGEEAYIRMVTDADLANWRESLFNQEVDASVQDIIE